jgi:hypothetical protein
MAWCWEDQQPELTDERISAWINQLSEEFINLGIQLSAIKNVAYCTTK